MKKRTIYRLTNLKNGKIYIGQTSVGMKERLLNYKKEIKHYPNRRYITRAINKWGFENFLVEVLYEEYCTKEHITEKENMLISYYNSIDPRVGYNLTVGASHGGHSIATKKKIGKSQTGVLNHMYGKRGKDSPSSKPVIDLTTGEKYNSVTEASERLNISLTHAASVARGERGSTGGAVLRYIKEDGSIIMPAKTTNIKSKKVRKSVKPEYIKYL